MARCISRRWLRCVSCGDRRGSVALEFAIVALPFITLLLFLAELGYDFYAQVALDYGVQAASRQIQTGAAQGASSAAAFQTQYLCPVVSGLLPCSSITVNVVPVASDYFTAVNGTIPTNKAGQLDTSGFSYCPGRPNQLMLVQAIYTSPSILSAVIPAMVSSVGGGFAHVTQSSSAFINENYPVTAASPAGC